VLFPLPVVRCFFVRPSARYREVTRQQEQLIVSLERLLDGHDGGCRIDPSTKIGSTGYSELLSTNQQLRSELIRMQKPPALPAGAHPAPLPTSNLHRSPQDHSTGNEQRARRTQLQQRILEAASRRDTLEAELAAAVRSAGHVYPQLQSDSQVSSLFHTSVEPEYRPSVLSLRCNCRLHRCLPIPFSIAPPPNTRICPQRPSGSTTDAERLRLMMHIEQAGQRVLSVQELLKEAEEVRTQHVLTVCGM